MILAEHLYKRYGRHEVVSDLSFSVRRGEILGFIGANGAGKSTTIKMLCGVLPIYAGKIEICGIDMAKYPLKAKSKIGYLPENAPLPSNMTVLSFLDYAAAMHGLNGKEKQHAIGQSLECCSLNGVTGMEIETLSKGYKRRVCLAQALLHSPEVLLLDEPTDGLDPIQKREIRNLIQALRQKTAVIISTHILEEIQSVCTNVLLLNQGKSVFHGSIGDFVSQKQKITCEALTFRADTIANVTSLLRKCCPGMARVNGNQVIMPGKADVDKIVSFFAENGIEVVKRESIGAGLDDIFSSLALSMDINLSTEPQPTENIVSSEERDTTEKPEDDDD